MEKHFKTLFLILSFSSCYGDLGKLSGFLIGAHQQIHNRVHGVAGAVLGGLNLNVHGQVSNHQRQPPPPPPPPPSSETIVVIVEENDQGGQPQRLYGTPQQGQYQPNGQLNSNGYNQGYNQNNGYGPNHGYQHNSRPNHPINNGQRPYQNGQNHAHNYENGNSAHQQHIPNYNPNQHGQDDDQTYNQNGQGNNNAHNNNVNPNNDGHQNPSNVISNNPNSNGNPEQNKPNLNDNYNPTETYNGQQHNDVHQAEHTHNTNDITTKKPEEGPLLVPLNDYNYGGDKIVINPPKRDIENKKEENSEEDFPIDIRFKDE